MGHLLIEGVICYKAYVNFPGYVRGNVHTNTLEGWFSLLKRGVNGTFHHVSEKHLDRYIDEFVHRYNWREMDDVQRTIKAIKGAPGKRLYYREPKGS